MKIAVTGASGFVGRHVLEALGRSGEFEIVATSRHGNDLRLSDGTSVRMLALDIAQEPERAYDRLGRPDVLIHLAWSGLPDYRSLHHFDTELAHQYRFLSELIRAGLPALVCAGTCFEYGMRSGPLDETMSPDPQNPYGFAKDALRRQLTFLRAQTPFNFTWARLFYMYGAGQSPHSLYGQLAAAGARGEQTFRMSGGEQLRDFLPVSEVAVGISALALNANDAGVVNICSGNPISIRTIAERWKRENNWGVDLEFGHYPYPDYEPMAFWGINRRFKEALAGR